MALLAFVLGSAMSLLLAEVALRIYNPVPMPIRGREIVLPVNKTIVRQGPPANAKIDGTIVLSRNSLGFRGPEPPSDFDDRMTIIVVGGSTTECSYLTDGKDWPSRLSRELQTKFPDIWVNNAGLDGHSTFGHAILMDQLLLDLKPDCILFLVGANDVGRDDLNIFDDNLLPDNRSRFNQIVAASELLATLQVLYRSWKASQRGLSHYWELDLRTAPTIELSTQETERILAEHEDLSHYEARIRRLITRCRDHGIEPILMTQPALYGDARDPETGVDIGLIEFNGMPASLNWRIIDLYNDATRRVAADDDVFLIDTAILMPKDSRLFYDWLHFTNEGAEDVASVVSERLIPFLESRTRRGS